MMSLPTGQPAVQNKKLKSKGYINVCTQFNDVFAFLEMYVAICTRSTYLDMVQACMYIIRFRHVCTLFRRVCTCLYKYIRALTHVNIYILCTNMYIHVCSIILIYIHICTYMFINLQKCIYMSIHFRVHKCMYMSEVTLNHVCNPFPKPIENVALNSEQPHRFGLACT